MFISVFIDFVMVQKFVSDVKSVGSRYFTIGDYYCIAHTNLTIQIEILEGK
jgi:hypothetical protein